VSTPGRRLLDWVLANPTASSDDPGLTTLEAGVETFEPALTVSHVIASVTGDTGSSFTKAAAVLTLNLDVLAPSLDTDITDIVEDVIAEYEGSTPTGTGYAFTPLFFNREASGGRATNAHRVYRLSFTTVAIAGTDALVTSTVSNVGNFVTGAEVFAFSIEDSCEVSPSARPSLDSLRTYRPSNPDTTGQILSYHLGGTNWTPPVVGVYPDVVFTYDAQYSRTLNILVRSVRLLADARAAGGPLVWQSQYVASQDFQVGQAFTMPQSDWAN
jgi:hypothetical protein